MLNSFNISRILSFFFSWSNSSLEETNKESYSTKTPAAKPNIADK